MIDGLLYTDHEYDSHPATSGKNIVIIRIPLTIVSFLAPNRKLTVSRTSRCFDRTSRYEYRAKSMPVQKAMPVEAPSIQWH